MYKRPIYIFIFSFLFISNGIAQSCPIGNLGQNPSTAFPVCGTSTFHQTTVPYCGGKNIPCPNCPRGPFSDKNPFWYKFTCFTSGTLGFLITPNTPEDYDWELFDITGHDPNDVYNDVSLIVAANWSAEYATTGTSNTLGSNLVECDGPGVNTYSRMPNIIVGHNYILLISHFSDTPNGYSLSFNGGTASITDPIEPHLLEAKAPCDGTLTIIKLNKAMKCNSLSADGSEFTITPAVANVIAAVGVGCSTSFDMQEINLTLDAPLPAGTYTISIKNGTDGNTLLDNCDRAIINETLSLQVFPLFPTPMDSITPVVCEPNQLQLVFKKNMMCSSVAADGSDFLITGPSTVNIASAAGLNCVNDLSNKIILKLANPIQVGGIYTVTLVRGSDGNTLLDQCTQETPAGSSINIVGYDTVNANFNYINHPGCKIDTFFYSHNGSNHVTSWAWNFDSLRSSTEQNPMIKYSTFDKKFTILTVSNGVCFDTSRIDFVLNNTLKAAYEASLVVCPGDFALFKNKSIGIGNIQYLWDFGNGTTSIFANPPNQTYTATNPTRTVLTKLLLTNDMGCKDSAFQNITVAYSCYIAVPNAFTPNGDGLNDYLYPLNAYKATNLHFSVYNRFGQKVFETNNWLNRWDGRVKGQPADAATYVWMLNYINTETGKPVFQKGTSILIR